MSQITVGANAAMVEPTNFAKLITALGLKYENGNIKLENATVLNASDIKVLKDGKIRADLDDLIGKIISEFDSNIASLKGADIEVSKILDSFVKGSWGGKEANDARKLLSPQAAAELMKQLYLLQLKVVLLRCRKVKKISYEVGDISSDQIPDLDNLLKAITNKAEELNKLIEAKSSDGIVQQFIQEEQKVTKGDKETTPTIPLAQPKPPANTSTQPASTKPSANIPPPPPPPPSSSKPVAATAKPGVVRPAKEQIATAAKDMGTFQNGGELEAYYKEKAYKYKAKYMKSMIN